MIYTIDTDGILGFHYDGNDFIAYIKNDLYDVLSKDPNTTLSFQDSDRIGKPFRFFNEDEYHKLDQALQQQIKFRLKRSDLKLNIHSEDPDVMILVKLTWSESK